MAKAIINITLEVEVDDIEWKGDPRDAHEYSVEDAIADRVRRSIAYGKIGDELEELGLSPASAANVTVKRGE